MPTLTHFHLNQGLRITLSWTKAVVDFEHGLDSILTDSIKTPELDASCDELDVVPSSLSSGFLGSVSTISDNS